MSRKINRSLAVADVETTMLRAGEKPKTLFWGLSIEGDATSYRRFKTSAEMWRFLEQSSPLKILVHHDYDLIQLMVDDFHPRVHIARGGRIIRAYSHKGRHEWQNSHAIFPSRLKDILASCGYGKHSLKNLAARNTDDTVYALKAFRALGEEYRSAWGIDPFGRYATAAGIAFAASQEFAGDLPIILTDRAAYSGGRTEIFRQGSCGRCDLYDVNSMYPAAIAAAPERDRLLYGVATVRDDIPPFFHLFERERLIFPAGKVPFACFESNLERFYSVATMSLKIEKRIDVDMSWLARLAPLVRDIYHQRNSAKEAGNKAKAYALKIGLNSVYGRLGLKGIVQRVYYKKRLGIPSPGNGPQAVLRVTLNGEPRYLVFRDVRGNNMKANYHYAAYITDYGRGALYGALKANTVFQCDTDSVFVPEGSAFSGTIGEGLGEWKYETTKPLHTYALKDYDWGEEHKQKGGKGRDMWSLKTLMRYGVPRAVIKQHKRLYTKRVRVTPYGRAGVRAWSDTKPIVRGT